MTLLYDFLILSFLFLIQSTFFVITGKCFYPFSNHENFYKEISSRYFIGLIASFSLIIILNFFIKNFYQSVWITLLSLLFFSISKINFIELKKHKIKILRSLLILFVILFLLLCRSTKSFPNDYFNNLGLINPYDGFPSVVHSFRAANISEFILSSNSIPSLSQHIGQSLISSSVYLFSHIGLQAILVFHLAFSMAFTLILFYGFYIQLMNKKRGGYYSKYYNIIFLVFIAGTPSLGFFYSSILDTESIFFLITNSDTLIGLSLFLITLNYIYCLRDKNLNSKNFLFIALNAFSWNLFASQNILLFLSLLLFLLFKATRFGFTKLYLFKIILVFVIFSVLGSQSIGGLLKIGPSDYSIPGVMQIRDYSSTHPLVELRIPRLSEAGSGTFKSLKEYYHRYSKGEVSSENSGVLADNYIKNVYINSAPHLFIYFAKILLSLKLVFFPLLFIFSYSYCRTFESRSLFTSPKLQQLLSSHNFNFFYESTVFLFVSGVIISSCFIFRGYTFELSKFLNIGLFFMMLFLSVFCNVFFDALTKWGKFTFFLVLLLPSFFEICIRTFSMILFTSFFDSLRLMFSLNGVFGLDR